MRQPQPPVKQHKSQQRRGHRQYVQYVPVGFADTHSKTVGYLLWIVGFTGAHRFYYGKQLTGCLWFFTFGLFGIGWVLDLFLIPEMDRQADRRYCPGVQNYDLAWLLLVFAGWLGFHRFYQEKWITGVLYFLTFGLFGIGVVFDVLTLNEQIDDANYNLQRKFHWQTASAW